MTKELEAKDLQANFIKCFNELLTKTDKDIFVVNISREMAQDMVNFYEKYLTINSSEALKNLDKLAKQIELDEDTDFWEIRNAHKTVEQALIKAQENEKVLKILLEKGLSLAERDMIKQSENYEQYQIKISWWNYKPFAIPKTEEEFNLLKRYFK